MVTVTDEKYSYTHLIGWNEKQKKETIKGQPDKQITIDLVSLYLESPSQGLATAWVTANGKQLGRWTSDKAEMQYFSGQPAFIAPSGSDVVLEWFLKSSSTTVKARMKLLSYDYSIVPAVITEPDEPEPVKNCILIFCKPDDNVDLQVSQVRGVVGDREIKVLREI